ncbi:hypothetical protein BU16DRAFT_564522 [Lophium mytilinum]|uniref:Uncharacterized protein n=1 Tax=Lophium mytilinum TaxID=390894 RepID=A0A6A6QJ51_9PEZI|nr:hypothetical protein BU16DRAFT_564522 [Lophium mytilinum]
MSGSSFTFKNWNAIIASALTPSPPAKGTDTATFSFAHWNAAISLLELGRTQQCISQCSNILAMPKLSEPHRQNTLCLIAICVATDTEDWDRAERFWHQGEEHWADARSRCPLGQDADVDSALERLRRLLDGLERSQAEAKGVRMGGEEKRKGGRGIQDELGYLIDELIREYSSGGGSGEGAFEGMEMDTEMEDG